MLLNSKFGIIKLTLALRLPSAATGFIPANHSQNRAEYERRVRTQAKDMAPVE